MKMFDLEKDAKENSIERLQEICKTNTTMVTPDGYYQNVHNSKVDSKLEQGWILPVDGVKYKNRITITKSTW